ncbi:hypothetical protein WR164_03970 [Philodulcilactobacillus myokoensis]|uniref:HTH tetR-type domain-containing protein n=1 Tax=Philodulcilactobacillus myokoensis TaxID=2929573 RepID=A0A9W6ESK2_9LACO|nr:TetR/AcrR family transcriptional regulator [Philodulcilactobacillus myokoensis]GLB46418.1 hypothetical protein WR164_03970 [Philodulcilactobacillus myokoensis]
MDLRIKKTYKALINAFLELIQQKSFKEISIQELCDHALVRRATFYHHFKNKEAFANFITNYFVRQIFPENFIKRTVSDTSELTLEETYRKYIKFLFEYIDRHKKLIDSLNLSQTLPIVIDALSDNLVDFYKKYLKVRNKRDDILQNVDPNLMANYIAGGLISALKYSFRNNSSSLSRKTAINHIAKIMYKLLN